jgi:hypothetical protein
MTEYERGDRFFEDLSYLDESEESGMSEFIREYQSVFEIRRVLEDKNTGQTLYYLQSIKGFETMLMTADEIEEMEAYKSEVEG